MRLILVRHGETDSNRRGLALGRSDVALTDEGRRQAAQVAASLSRDPLAAIYASPLLRTIETANPIAAVHGLSVQVEPRLIEMDVGELEGLSFSELRELHPGLLRTWAGPDGPQTPMPGGERLMDVQTRAVEVAQSLCEKHGEDAICVVTHNFVILSLLAHALGVDLAGFRRLRHALGGITTLEMRPELCRVITLNDTCHLHA